MKCQLVLWSRTNTPLQFLGVRNKKGRMIVVTTTRTPRNVYILNVIGREECRMGKTYESFLWHKRMGHLRFDILVKVSKNQVFKGMQRIINPSNIVWKDCQHGKQTKVNFRIKEYSTSRLLQIIHIDLFGLTKSKKLHGDHYFMLLINDYTRMTWVSFIKHK